MKTTVNERIVMLKDKLGKENSEFIAQGNISNGTLWNIENGKNISSKTIKSIASAFNVNPEWLKHGKGEMFFNNPVNEDSADSNPWREEAYASLRSEVEFLKKQYAQLFDAVVSGKLGKLLALKFASEFGVEVEEALAA